MIQNNDLLASVMPVISAISGNIGLQSAAITIRELALGLVEPNKKGVCKQIQLSLWMGFYLGAMSGLILGVIFTLWSYEQTKDIQDALRLGAVIFTS